MEEIINENGNTTPESQNSSTVKIKFNKEIREIPEEQAVALAQKGMKFDLIADDFNKLKNLAKADNMSTGEFLDALIKRRENERFESLKEQAGGNEEVARKLLSLENGNVDDGFSELKAEFPEINEIGDLPQSVTDAAALKGSNLLNEYLRFLHAKKREAEEQKRKEEESRKAGTGSQRSMDTTAYDDFLKGIWNK